MTRGLYDLIMKSITLSPKLSRIIERTGIEEKKDFMQIIEEALRIYLNRKKRWAEIRKWGAVSAKKTGVSNMRQIEKTVDGFRR